MINASRQDLTKSVFKGALTGLGRFASPSPIAFVYVDRKKGMAELLDPFELIYGKDQELGVLFHGAKTTSELSHGIDSLFGERNVYCITSTDRENCNHIWLSPKQNDWCSPDSVERYLYLASTMLTSAMRAKRMSMYSQEPHTSAIESLGFTAIARQLNREMKLKYSSVSETSFLDSASKIATTLEEGAYATGRIALVPKAEDCQDSWLLEFSAPLPLLSNAKHVRKLLGLSFGDQSYLITDGNAILGVAKLDDPSEFIQITFRSGRGVILKDGKPFCTFADGLFSIQTPDHYLTPLQILLKEKSMEGKRETLLLEHIKSLVEAARSKRHGCAFLLNLSDTPFKIAGQRLAAPIRIDSTIHKTLIEEMCFIDGAIYIDSNLEIVAFGCIMDGPSIEFKEDRSRGSRYNAAIRFTNENPSVLVMTVSEDGPVAIFSKGNQCSKKLSLTLDTLDMRSLQWSIE